MGSCSTLMLHCHCFVVSVTISLSTWKQCVLAERLDLVHHIPQAAISDWHKKDYFIFFFISFFHFFISHFLEVEDNVGLLLVISAAAVARCHDKGE